MLEFLRESFRNHFGLTLIAAVLITLGLFTTVSTLLPSSREIFYEMHPVFTLCRPASGSSTCVARMELNIGNTGETEESVNLVWPQFKGGWTSGKDIFDISADRPRGHDPVVNCAATDGRQECDIDRFAAGTLIVMHIDCTRCNRRQVKLLQETPLEIHTGAHAVYGNPRDTLLWRRLMAFAQLF